MANEIQTDQPGLTGQVVYAVVFNGVGQAWNGTAFVAVNPANWTSYALTLTEVTGTGLFRGDMPAAAAGTYFVVARRRVGGSPAITDPAVAAGTVQWAGSTIGTVLAAAGLDLVVVEAGLNARQAMSIAVAAAAGQLAGGGTTTVTIAAAGVPATTRITATVDASGNRSAVTLSPPA